MGLKPGLGNDHFSVQNPLILSLAIPFFGWRRFREVMDFCRTLMEALSCSWCRCGLDGIAAIAAIAIALSF